MLCTATVLESAVGAFQSEFGGLSGVGSRIEITDSPEGAALLEVLIGLEHRHEDALRFAYEKGGIIRLDARIIAVFSPG